MKKVLSLLVCIALVFSFLNTTVHASGDTVKTETDLVEALKSEGTVILGADIELTQPLTVNKKVTLDLNGYSITQSKACSESYSMITVDSHGDLTVKGNGKISFKDTGEGDPSFGWGSYTLSIYGGKLTVENGVIEHLGEQNTPEQSKHMICAIFQYSGSSVINGGTISTPNYRSARLWKGDMTVNGGTFDGQLWVQAVDSTSDLTINGGTFGPNGGDGSSVYLTNGTYPVALSITGGNFTTKLGYANAETLKGTITGGTFTNDVSALIAEGYTLVKVGDQYSAVELKADKVSSAAELLAALKTGGDIVLENDITFNNFGKTAMAIANGKTVNLDLNGYKLSGNNTHNTSNSEFILNTGNLTIKDSSQAKTGTIEYVYKGQASNYAYTANTITNDPNGVLVIEDGTIVNNTNLSNQLYYTIDIRTNGGIGDSTVTINGGTVSCPNYCVIRQFGNSTSKANTLNLNGGYISSMVVLQSSNANANIINTKVDGAQLNAVYRDKAVYVWSGGANPHGTVTLSFESGIVNGAVHFESDPSEVVNVNLSIADTFTKSVDETDESKFYLSCNHKEKDSLNNATDPTCAKNGHETDYKCTNCNKVFNGKTLSSLGHNLVENKCTRCDYEVKVEVEIITQLPEVVEDVTIVTKEETKDVIEETKNEIIELIAKGEDVTHISNEAKEAIKEAIINNDNINIKTEVSVKTVSEELIENETVKAIEKLVDKGTIATYLDISILMNVSISNDNQSPQTITTEITELSKPVTFTIAIPEELKDVQAGYRRTYYVIRSHEGIVEKLPVTVNDDGTLSFETDRFSTYALTYVDSRKVVNTSDETDIVLYASLLMVALGATVILRRKEEM